MGIGGRKTPLALWYCGLEKGTAISWFQKHLTDKLFGGNVGIGTLEAGATQAARVLPSAVGDRMTVAMKAAPSCTRGKGETVAVRSGALDPHLSRRRQRQRGGRLRRWRNGKSRADAPFD